MTSASLPVGDLEQAAARSEELVPVTPSLDMSWLRPVWLRPYLLITVLGVHVAGLGVFLLTREEKVTPMQEIEVSVIPQGESVTEVSTVAAPQTAPIASPDPLVDSAPEIAQQTDVSKPIEAETLPEIAPILSAPLPKIEVADAPTIAVTKPDLQKADKQQPTPSEKVAQAHRKKQREAERRHAMRAVRLAQERAHAKQQAAEFSEGAAAVHAGVHDGSDVANRMSQAAYAGLVSAELNRHKIYPPEARAEGAQGRVGVVLSIGSSGTIVSHSITHSSGNRAIDAAVHLMVAASHLPPPPSGTFHGSVGINFSLAR
jgi:periplasmic protein TonB